MSLGIQDKVINHYVTKYILNIKLEKFLDIRNVATRKNMGTSYAIKLIKKYIEQHKKYKIFYVLKMDISKYFYNIDHDVIKNNLINKLDNDEYDIISSINELYINDEINKIINKNPNSNLPICKYNKGLSIGAVSNQILSIFYLEKLDHKIVHDFEIKHYVRFMDDFILFHYDKNYLKQILNKIEYILNNEYKLKLNNKTMIVSSKNGFNFIGYNFKIGNKTVVKIKNSTLKKIKVNIRKKTYLYKNNKISFKIYFSTYNLIRIRRFLNEVNWI